jgi:hypothetical protein
MVRHHHQKRLGWFQMSHSNAVIDSVLHLTAGIAQLLAMLLTVMVDVKLVTLRLEHFETGVIFSARKTSYNSSLDKPLSFAVTTNS